MTPDPALGLIVKFRARALGLRQFEVAEQLSDMRGYYLNPNNLNRYLNGHTQPRQAIAELLTRWLAEHPEPEDTGHNTFLTMGKA